MHPVFNYISRKCTEAVDMTDYDGKRVRIDRNVAVRIPVLSIHYDAEYYSEPNKFDPDRFRDASGGAKELSRKGVFLAWSDGPRICLGT